MASNLQRRRVEELGDPASYTQPVEAVLKEIYQEIRDKVKGRPPLEGWILRIPPTEIEQVYMVPSGVPSSVHQDELREVGCSRSISITSVQG